MGSREGRPNSRPARWAVVLDQLRSRGAPCMTQEQWTLYLSGVAIDAMCDRAEAQRISRGGVVSPCAHCSRGFKADAEARGACVPGFFGKERVA